MRTRASLFMAGLTAVLLCCGCSSSDPSKAVNGIYLVQQRQLPPQPVYGRLRLVRPPEVLPARSTPAAQARLLPIIQWDLQRSTLREATLVIGAAARYRTYCAASIGEKPINLNMLGTVEEAAAELARQSGAKVQVDHETKEIRVTAGLLGAL